MSAQPWTAEEGHAVRDFLARYNYNATDDSPVAQFHRLLNRVLIALDAERARVKALEEALRQLGDYAAGHRRTDAPDWLECHCPIHKRVRAALAGE